MAKIMLKHNACSWAHFVLLQCIFLHCNVLSMVYNELFYIITFTCLLNFFEKCFKQDGLVWSFRMIQNYFSLDTYLGWPCALLLGHRCLNCKMRLNKVTIETNNYNSLNNCRDISWGGRKHLNTSTVSFWSFKVSPMSVFRHLSIL